MRLFWFAYVPGVIAGAAVGFFSPWWFLGFAPLSAGLIWAAYDLEEVASDEPSPPSSQRRLY